tara:strand:+ start:288 stop:692 length:405 start_codon:yes stop_codon:yes gene_type:complete
MKEKIIIYTSKTCPYCEQVKTVLKENSIKFTEIDIIEYKKVWNIIKNLSGVPSVPTIKLGDDILAPGRDFFNPENLIEILLDFNKSEYSDERRALELIKTLNFNMYTAFNNINHRLQQIENKLNKEEDEHKSTS